MSAITPNTVVRFGQVGLMINSEDTFYFNNVADQTTFFMNNLDQVFTKYTYQREHRDYLKIEITSEQQADRWDYMMFQNTSYGNKWFYAFVTQTEWINNLTVKVYYVIDYIQTYWQEYNEGQCFIEREHTTTDNIGDNIVPEKFELGEYVFNPDTHDIGDNISDNAYAVFIVADDDGQEFDNVYVGGEVYAFQVTNNNISTINNFVRQHQQRQDIVAAYMVPGIVMERYTMNSDHKVTGSDTTWYHEVAARAITGNDLLNGYRPENKKLYTYPYNFYYITDNNGNNLTLRYEFFTDKTPRLVAGGSASTPTFLSYIPDPSYYKVSAPNAQMPWSPSFEKLTIGGFPIVAFTYDAFNSWASRSLTTSIVRTVAKAGLGAIAGGLIAGPGGAIMGALGASGSTLAATQSPNPRTSAGASYQAKGEAQGSTADLAANTIAQGYQASIESDIFKGSYNAGSSPFCWEYYIQGIRASISYQYAEIIDHYFTMYGYAKKTVATPSRHNRSRFTYVKTIDCYIYGELPSEAKEIIASKYNRGIRFWVVDGHFRDFSISNLPLH